MAPPTAGEDTSNPDSDDPPKVAVALDEADDGLADAIESALAGRSAIVAVGVPLALLPDTRRERAHKGRNMAGRLSAGRRRRAWPGVRPRHRGRRGGRGGSDRASDGRGRTRRPANSVRVAGPNRRGRRTGEGSNTRYRGGAETSHARGPSGARAVRGGDARTVDMPARSRLLAAACETLDDRFADDVAAVLDALPYGAVGRTGEVTDRTLLVALAARHDHLLWDLRRWIGDGADGGERRRRRDRRWTGPHRRPASPRAARPDRGDQDARGRRPPAAPAPGGRRRAAPRDARRGAQRAPRAVRAPGRRGRAGPTAAARPRRAATGLGADAT